MGTRIHKVLGYGTQILAKPENIDFLYDGRRVGEVHDLLYAEYQRMDLEKTSGRVSLAYETKHPRWRGDYPETFDKVIHWTEHPDNDLGRLVFVPPSQFRAWYRYDNTLDYYEVASKPDTPDRLDTKCVEAGHPIYPFMGLMHAETGEQLRGDGHMELKEEYGALAVATVPLAVRLIAEHCKLLDGPKPWLKLRPMIVTWWS